MAAVFALLVAEKTDRHRDGLGWLVQGAGRARPLDDRIGGRRADRAGLAKALAQAGCATDPERASKRVSIIDKRYLANLDEPPLAGQIPHPEGRVTEQ